MFQAVKKETVVSSFHMHCNSEVKIKEGTFSGLCLSNRITLLPYPPCPLALQQHVPSHVSLPCWLEAERKDCAATLLLLKSVSHLHLCAAYRTWHSVDWTPPITSAHLCLYRCTPLLLAEDFSLCLQSVLVLALTVRGPIGFPAATQIVDITAISVSNSTKTRCGSVSELTSVSSCLVSRSVMSQLNSGKASNSILANQLHIKLSDTLHFFHL